MITVITVAAGCFWGTQAFFDLQKGVIKTVVGYANGNLKTVTYEEVCTGKTGFVEACQITFDSDKVSLAAILTQYWSIINPTLLNQQGNDIGSQYRTGIYYDHNFTSDMISVIVKSQLLLQEKYDKPIVTEILPLKNFVVAEEYHQKYLTKNPNGYCHINLKKF